MISRRSIYHRSLAMVLPVWMVVWPSMCCCVAVTSSATAAETPTAAHVCCADRTAPVPTSQPWPDQDHPHTPCLACPTRAVQQSILPATFAWPDLQPLVIASIPWLAMPVLGDGLPGEFYPPPALQAPTLLRLRCAFNL